MLCTIRKVTLQVHVYHSSFANTPKVFWFSIRKISVIPFTDCKENAQAKKTSIIFPYCILGLRKPFVIVPQLVHFIKVQKRGFDLSFISLLSTYLDGRFQFDKTDNHSYNSVDIVGAVLKGFVVDPL